MGCEIIKVNDQTFRIEDDTVRFFVLTGDDKALLVDSGMNTPNAREIAQSITDLPIILINTHADIDHISGNKAFDKAYMSPSEAAFYHNTQKCVGDIIPVWEDDIIELGSRVLKVIMLPGHTSGSIGLLDEKYRVLISGDNIQDGRIFMFGDNRDMFAYIHSLERLELYKDNFDTIYPSHGSFPLKADIIPKLIKGAKLITQNKLEHTEADFMGKKIWVYDVNAAKFLCEAREF